MITIKDVVKALKELPQLKHINTKILYAEIKSLIEKCNSDIIHIRTTKKLIPLEKFHYIVNESGDRDEDVIDIRYNNHYYQYWVNFLIEKNGKKYFTIDTLHCKCPLCGNKITLKYIGSKIIEGGYTVRAYKNVDNQAMCFDCSNKIDRT